MHDKVLPNENSDYNLPGRREESNYAIGGFEDIISDESKQKNHLLAIGMVAFTLIGAGFFSYYFLNQSEIDSQIIDNTALLSIEQKMAKQYGVGEFGSDHAHAALVMFVDGARIDFAAERFQLKSKYIHFENHNPYIIHKHATGVPLDMLFTSLGLSVTQECIGLTNVDMYCTDSERSMTLLINGERQIDIRQYEIEHNDRILVSFGDSRMVAEQIQFLESLEIHDIPKQERLTPGKNISV